VLSHRAEIGREEAMQRQIEEQRALQEKYESEAKAKEIERDFGKAPNHDDAYSAIKSHLKEILKDPDSLEMGNVSELYPADFNGRKCWAGKVVYRSRDAMGAYQASSGTAYLEGEIVIGFTAGQP
jgi:hypothetical protein